MGESGVGKRGRSIQQQQKCAMRSELSPSKAKVSQLRMLKWLYYGAHDCCLLCNANYNNISYMYRDCIHGCLLKRGVRSIPFMPIKYQLVKYGASLLRCDCGTVLSVLRWLCIYCKEIQLKLLWFNE